MSRITVISNPDIDADLNLESNKIVSMGEIETYDQLARFFSEAARSIGFTGVEGVIFFGDDGSVIGDSEGY